MKSRNSTGWVSIIAILVAVVLGLLWFQKSDGSVGSNPTVPVSTAPAPYANAPSTFADIAQKLEPVVVNIFTTSNVQGYGDQSAPDDFFRRFLPSPQARPQRSLGSGFIIDRDGYVVTNYHVVENAQQIQVQLFDERSFTAELVGADPKTDIALIRIKTDKPMKFQPAVLGDSDALRVGDWILAVGNPFGLSHTVTAGIVSAKGRFIGNTEYDDLIQTDAAINPGNSGGPMVNMRGEVVGISSSIFTRTGGYMGIGFGIPINLAKQVISQLKDFRKVERSWLGVGTQKITPEAAQSFGMEKPMGAIVNQVLPNSPAEKAGLKEEDIIVAINDHEIADPNALMRQISLMPAGSQVKLTVIRGGKKLDLMVQLMSRPSDNEMNGAVPGVLFDYKLGLGVFPLSPADASRLGIPGGVVVVKIDPNGSAARGMVMEGDVIVRINGTNVTNIADFKNIAANMRRGSLVRMQVIRGNEKAILVFLLQ